MHDRVKENMRISARKRTCRGGAPGDPWSWKIDVSQSECADRFAAQRRDRTNESSACKGMRRPVYDGIFYDHAVAGLKIHKDLRAAENHEAEFVAADSLEECTRSKMKWCEWHGRSEIELWQVNVRYPVLFATFESGVNVLARKISGRPGEV